MKWRVLLAAALCLAPILAQTPRGQKRFALRGQVVDGLSGRPMAGLELALHTSSSETATEPITTDPEGRFVFRGLAAGVYILNASRPDFGTIFYGESPEPGATQGVRVGAEGDQRVILFRLTPRSEVTGVVRDELGDVVVGANVTVSRPVWRDGQVALEYFNATQTDDRGRYRISNLAPGRYVVCAAATGAGSVGPPLVPVSGPVDFASRSEPRFYARSCYPKTSAASLLRLAPGQHAEIDVTLASTSAVWVRGRILSALPKPNATVRLIREDLYEADWFLVHGPQATQEKFAFRGVTAGRYRLEAETIGENADGTQKKALIARLPIEVGAADLDGIEIKLEPAGEIDVVLHGVKDNKIEPGAVDIGLRSTVPGPSSMQWAGRDRKDALRLVSLFPGSYWLVTRTKESVCVRSAKLGEQDVLHGALTVTPGMTARLDVTISGECARIKGRVVSNDKAAPDSKVLLLLSGSAKDPGDLVTDYADDRGEFSFAGLPAGRYQLWAWGVDGSFVGPATLADQEERATTVVVREGETATADVRPLKPEGEPK